MTPHPLSALSTRRKMTDIRASDIAQRIGLETESYRRLERGERRCYLDKALIIAKTIGCTVEQLGTEPTIEEKIEHLKAGETARAQQAKDAHDVALGEALSLADETTAEVATASERTPAAAATESAQAVIEPTPTEITETVTEPGLANTADKVSLDDLISRFGDDDGSEDGDGLISELAPHPEVSP